MTDPGTPPPRFTHVGDAHALLALLGGEFAVLPGPPHAFPPYEIIPLAPKRDHLAGWPEAILLDMDGTLTSTEPLCLRALEEVLRLATGHEDDPDWRGLDPERDYPYLIGNSTSTHVEYIMQTYAGQIVPEALQRHGLDAALWGMTDWWGYERCRESISAYGLTKALRESGLREMASLLDRDSRKGARLRQEFTARHHTAVPVDTLALRTRAGVDIYYRWWHRTLERLSRRRNKAMETQDTDGATIEAMPGAGAFLALTKGWLGDEAEKLAPMLCAHLGDVAPSDDDAQAVLRQLGMACAERPLRLAVVTAAEMFEADHCLNIAMKGVRAEVASWPISAKCRKRVRAGLKDLDETFDLVVTANDATEARLKPHRDLYTTALQRLGIEPDAYDRVLGIEDSYAGVTALRAAGIGLAVAVPFEHSGAQDYTAAAYEVKGGLPAVILKHGLFLPES